MPNRGVAAASGQPAADLRAAVGADRRRRRRSGSALRAARAASPIRMGRRLRLAVARQRHLFADRDDHAPLRQGSLTAALAGVGGWDTTDTLARQPRRKRRRASGTSQAAAQQGATLALVDSELLAYESATLTGTNAYKLTGLQRGLYGTSPRRTPPARLSPGSTAPSSHTICRPIRRPDALFQISELQRFRLRRRGSVDLRRLHLHADRRRPVRSDRRAARQRHPARPRPAVGTSQRSPTTSAVSPARVTGVLDLGNLTRSANNCRLARRGVAKVAAYTGPARRNRRRHHQRSPRGQGRRDAGGWPAAKLAEVSRNARAAVTDASRR